MAKILGFDSSNRVSNFFTMLGIKDLFILPENSKTGVGEKLLHAFNFFRNLSKFAKKHDSFVFIAPPYFVLPSVLALRLLKKRVVLIVIEPYGEIAMEKLWGGPFHIRLLRKLMYPIYELSEYLSVLLADAVFSSPACSFKKYKRLGVKNLYRIYTGTDVEMVSHVEPKTYDKETIYYMGSLLKWRGVDLLLRAFEIVKRKHDVQLVMPCGIDHLKWYPEVRELLPKMGNDVILMEYLPHKECIAYLKGAKIAIIPNRESLMSRAISSTKGFEYIAAEVPQVCTDTGEHADWVRKLSAGVVVKDTLEDIANGIMSLLEDKKMYGEIKENCKKRKWEIDYKTLRKPVFQYFESLPHD